MHTINQSDGSASEALAQVSSLRALRLKQVAVLTALAITVRMVLPFFAGMHLGATEYALAAGLGLVLLSLWLCHIQRMDAAGALLIVTLTVMVCTLIWRNQGLQDAALLVFPGLLIFCGMLARMRVFYGLLVFLVVFIGVMAWRTATGLHVTITDPNYSEYVRALDLLLILAVSGISVQAMTRDLHQALESSQKATRQLQESQASLAYMAQHDALTGLPNRRMGRDRISQAMQHARRSGAHVAVLFVDLDNFKSINDAYGHDFGDKFLKNVAERLLAAVREADIVSRQGGDEFVIGITDVVDSTVVPAIALKVLSLLREPVSFNGQGVFASCSIGIAIFPGDGDNFDVLMHLADMAMYQAKKAGRNTYAFSTPQRSDTQDLIPPETP